jgi:hypothetical protein
MRSCLALLTQLLLLLLLPPRAPAQLLLQLPAPC